MQRLLRLFTVAACVLAAPSLAHANFHLWDIEEVFSNDSGDIQYIELSTTSSGQQVLAAHTITFTAGAVTNTFTFPGNSPAGTANKHLLIATPGFARLAGAVTPDFTLPCGPLFDPDAATITIDFGEGASTLTISATPIPQDGVHALVNGVVANASPQNFAGTVGTMNLTTGQNDGTVDICDDGLFCNGAETCAAAACTGTDPCPGALMCDETTDACFECDDAGDCDDGNACTDDTCNGSLVCVHTNNTVACDDGLFCTQTDACSGGACVGAGATCGADNCSEGGDFCGDCDGPEDCTDDVFCNGAEVCTTGACGAAASEACDPGTQTCDEDNDACDDLARDAGVDEPDAEVDAPDAGTTTPPDEDAGCCSTGAPATGSAVLALFALISLAGTARARRTRSSRRR